MTPELLQRVAKCAPEWMGAEYNHDNPTGTDPHRRNHVFFSYDKDRLGAVLVGECNDSENGDACVLMREAIRRDGKSWVMYCEEQGPKYGMQIDSAFLGWRNENETIATVHAFLKVFEKEEA